MRARRQFMTTYAIVALAIRYGSPARLRFHELLARAFALNST